MVRMILDAGFRMQDKDRPDRSGIMYPESCILYRFFNPEPRTLEP
jgi:hypothetical protein